MGQGQLGNTTFSDSATPVTVVGCLAIGGSTSLQCADDGTGITLQTLDHVVAIAAGTWHALALQDNGFVWAWGLGDWGQLGIGTPVPQPGLAIATPVSSLSRVRSIAAGVRHSLAVRHAGELFAWGDNSSGQLGDGTYGERYLPVPVPGVNVADVVAGDGHSAALMSDGTVQAWGSNAYGELGDGQPLNQSHIVAALVGSSNAPLVDVEALAASHNHTLAMLGDGTVRAWGSGWFGQLGNGGNAVAENLPVEVQTLTPIQIPLLPGQFGVAQVAAGQSHSLALDAACNAVWSWGSNDVGELGNGSSTGSPRSSLSGILCARHYMRDDSWICQARNER